jgi:serine/threonine protein kinase
MASIFALPQRHVVGYPMVAMIPAGQRLGEFEIIERIGQGGMGSVYKARQISLDRMIALKTLHAALAEDVEYIARFRQEAKAAAALNHPNLVHVHSAGETEGLHWFAMEYVEGESARARMERQGRLDALEAIAISIYVVAALEYGWQKAGLIHRDIKPDNIFLSNAGEAKLGDLGLAKRTGQNNGLTASGASMGSPNYISPEQVHAMKSVDPRADIYSLGCTLYHLVSGRPPYAGDSAVAVMMKHVSAPVPNLRSVWPECPPELEAIVMKMMLKSPEERPQSYADVNAELRQVYNLLDQRSAPAEVATAPLSTASRKAAAPEPSARGVLREAAASKSKFLCYAGIGAGIVVIAFGAIFLSQSKKEKVAKPRISAPEAAAHEASGSPGTATKDSPFVNTLGMTFVPVEITGGPTNGRRVLFSIWDTRVQDYTEYVRSTRRTLEKPSFDQGPSHPVVNVSWDDATTFCAWLTEKERASGTIIGQYAYRLPSDHEWSCAVGIGRQEKAEESLKSKRLNIVNTYPWGDQWPPPRGAGNYGPSFTVDEFPFTSPVGSFAANRNGLFDMGGNVWQWCQDWFEPTEKIQRVIRGESWRDDESFALASSFRNPGAPGQRSNEIGFRCVLAEDVPAP